MQFYPLDLNLRLIVITTNYSPSQKKLRSILILALAVWIPTLILLWLYKTGSSDEGAYHYQALFLSKGNIPVIDFFTTHAIWAHLPFAAIIKLTNHSIEAARLFSVFSVSATVFMVTALIRKNFSLELAIYSFFMMAFSWTWIENNLEVRHSSVANLCLISAVFVFFSWKDNALLRIFLVGLLLGIAVNSRIVLAPMGLIFLIIAVLLEKKKNTNLKIYPFISVFVMGSLIPSLPTLYILFTDFNASLYNYIIHRQEHSSLNTQNSAIDALSLFFVTGESKFHIIYLLPVFLSTTFILIKAKSEGLILIKNAFTEPIVLVSITFILGIIFCYSFADKFATTYLHHLLPFLVLLGFGLFAKIHEHLPLKINRWFFKTPIILAITILVVNFYGKSGIEIILRSDPFYKRPLAVTQISCWVERNFTTDSEIMSYNGAVAAVSGRTLPRGYEQGLGILTFFWENPIKLQNAKRYQILTLDRYIERLKSGNIRVLIDEGLANRRLSESQIIKINNALRDNYYLVPGEFTGTPYRVLAHNSINPATLTLYKPKPWFRLGKDGVVRNYFHKGEYYNLLKFITPDIVTSIKSLPNDLLGSLSRLLGGQYESRCNFFRD